MPQWMCFRCRELFEFDTIKEAGYFVVDIVIRRNMTLDRPLDRSVRVCGECLPKLRDQLKEVLDGPR